MTDQSDYRLYLDRSFEGINDKLDAIKEQTTKTNGRVTDLEGAVDVLHDKILLHPSECSKAKDIDALREDLIEYKFFKRYPKMTVIMVAVFAIGIFISAYGTFSTIHNNVKDKALKETVDIINKNTK